MVRTTPLLLFIKIYRSAANLQGVCNDSVDLGEVQLLYDQHFGCLVLDLHATITVLPDSTTGRSASSTLIRRDVMRMGNRSRNSVSQFGSKETVSARPSARPMLSSLIVIWQLVRASVKALDARGNENRQAVPALPSTLEETTTAPSSASSTYLPANRAQARDPNMQEYPRCPPVKVLDLSERRVNSVKNSAVKADQRCVPAAKCRPDNAHSRGDGA